MAVTQRFRSTRFRACSVLCPERLDYAIPDYRDLKNAKYLYYAASEFLKEKGIKNLIAISEVNKHRNYLKRIGFKEDTENKNIFRKQL